MVEADHSDGVGQERSRLHQCVVKALVSAGYRWVTVQNVSDVHRRMQTGQPINGCLETDIATALRQALIAEEY